MKVKINKQVKTMQIKKFLATGLAALMAGATLASAALAADLSGFPGNLATTTSAGSSLNAIVVVGDTAAAADIVGGINVAARLAQDSYALTSAPGVAGTVSYTNGVSLNTQNSNLHLGDNVNAYRTTITSTDLPNLLAAGTVSDTSGNTYGYNQYLSVSTAATKYGTPGSLTSPTMYVDYSSTTYPLTAKVVFTNPLPIGSTTYGQTINLFGNSYSIGSSSTNTTLVLFSASANNDITINAGSSQTVTIGGTSYTISVPGVNGNVATPTGTVTINGQSAQVTQGNSYTIAGLTVYIKTLTAYTAPTSGGLIELLAGSNQINLQTGQPVTLGSLSSPTTTITGSSVTITPVSGQSKISEVDIQLPVPSTAQYLASGSTWTDPVFGSISATFTGITPSSGDTLSFTAPSSIAAAVSFMDNHGNSPSVTFAYNSSATINLADGSGYKIHVVENESAKANEYVMLDAGNFTNMFKITSITNATSSAAGQVTMSDVFSGSTVTLSTGTVATDSGTVYINGQAYTMYVNATSGNQVAFDWNGASKAAVFPYLETKNGNWVAFTTALTSLTIPDTYTLLLPGGTVASNTTAGTGLYNVGNVTYKITGDGTSYTAISINGVTTPAVVTWEEPVGTDPVKMKAVIVSTTATGQPMYVTYNAPTLDAGSFGSGTASGTTTTTYYDNYGTLATYNNPSGSAATMTVQVPSVESVVNIGVGGTTASASTAGSTGGTIKSVQPITAPVAYLASEVEASTALKTSNNLVLVGGPCVNQLVQDLVNAGSLNSTYTCANGNLGAAWTPGTAYVLLVNNAFATGKVAMVVAGTAATDTRLATSVLQNFDAANVAGKLTGTAVKVTGTDYTTASITASST